MTPIPRHELVRVTNKKGTNVLQGVCRCGMTFEQDLDKRKVEPLHEQFKKHRTLSNMVQ